MGEGDDASEEHQRIQFEQVDQMTELGYNNISAFLNLSTVSILLCIYAARVAIYLSYQAYKKYKENKNVQYEGGDKSE